MLRHRLNFFLAHIHELHSNIYPINNKNHQKYRYGKKLQNYHLLLLLTLYTLQ